MEPNEWCRKFLESTQDMICIIDDDTKIIYVNPHFVEVLGYSFDELVGSPIDAYIFDNSVYQVAVKQAIEHKRPTFVELVLQTSTRSRVWVNGHIFPWIEDLEIRGLFCCFHDTTQFHLEQESFSFERSEIQRLLDILGHDMSSIHQEVVSAIELAIAENTLAGGTVDILKGVLSEVNRALNIINNIIKMIHVTQLDILPHPMDYLSILEKARDSIREEYADRSIILDIPPKENYLVLGIDLLEEVFRAIFAAAIELESEKISLKSELIDDETGRYVLLIFLTYGKSISVEETSQLFSEPVIGLNRTMGRLLSLAKKILEKIGGSFEIETVGFRDTSTVQFKVKLPLANERESIEEAQQ